MKRVLAIALVCSMAGCSDPSAPPADTGGGTPDTGARDTGVNPVDTGTTPTDTGITPMDTGVPPTDAGTDAFVAADDTGIDAFVTPDAFVGTDGGDGCSLTTYPTLTLTPVGDFRNPLGIVQIPGSVDMAVVEHRGRIQRMLPDGSAGPEFINIGTLTGGTTFSEQGLLGLAFHPDYATNGLFYVYYAPVGGDTNVVAVGHRSTTNPMIADPTVTPILTLTMDAYSNHNGGNLVFGPDGLLYIGTGDGGSGGDPDNHGQALDTWYGKILRIRVGPGIPTYEIPSTNPFAATAGLDEIYAYGLRNPWRFSFDRYSGALFIGDVGQNAWEEIDVDTDGMGGDNYGWRICEGTHDYGGGNCGALAGHHGPVLEYPHTGGGLFMPGTNASVTGGVVYRGSAIPGLYGTYLFGEEVVSRIAGFRYCGGMAQSPHVFTELDGDCSSPASFGENAAGEVFVACVGATTGSIRRVDAM